MASFNVHMRLPFHISCTMHPTVSCYSPPNTLQMPPPCLHPPQLSPQPTVPRQPKRAQIINCHTSKYRKYLNFLKRLNRQPMARRIPPEHQRFSCLLSILLFSLSLHSTVSDMLYPNPAPFSQLKSPSMSSHLTIPISTSLKTTTM